MTAPLNVAGVVLVLMGLLGAFDIAYYHRRAKLASDDAGRPEAAVHVVRGFVYSAQFLLLPNVRFAGAWFVLLAALYILDVAIAMFDVWIEPAARAPRGGLPRGEYLAHIVLSVLAGVYLTHVFYGTALWASTPSELVFAANMALPLRLLLGVMGIGCAVVALYELFELVGQRLPDAPPVHVRVRIPTSRERLWNVTQDHRLHPTWDARFSRIVMLADEVRAGTEMLYERDVLGLTIRGFGRYKHHRPLRQSTFEFWSDDPRSLIERGVGLWLYKDCANGEMELHTSYDYEVRWGGVGRVLDRLVLRPWMGWATGRSFERLARAHFGVDGAPTSWVVANKPRALA